MHRHKDMHIAHMCIFIGIHSAHMHAYTDKHTGAQAHTGMHTHRYTQVSIFIDMYPCTFRCAYSYVHTGAQMHRYTDKHTCIYTAVHIRRHTQVSIFIGTHLCICRCAYAWATGMHIL